MTAAKSPALLLESSPTSSAVALVPVVMMRRAALSAVSAANGETDDAIVQKKVEMEKFATLYKNPAINAGMTFLEPMPVALIVALVSAGVLSRRRKVVEAQEA